MPEANARSTIVNSREKGAEKPWSTFAFLKNKNKNMNTVSKQSL